MESLFGRYKNALVLMLVLLAQVVLLAMQVRRPAPGMPDGHNVRLWRYLVTSAIAPPERLAHNVGKSLGDLWSGYVYLRDLRQQNLSLRQEIDRLRIEQASLAEDAQQGERLRALLDFRGRYIDKTVAAQVIGTSGTDQARDILIDKGSQDGLEAQMPVITPDGIVGKIKNVYPHSAQVLLISDQTSGTGVLLEATRVRGVMKGDASGQPRMVNISPDDRIKPGEPVITSGGDEVYPPGMPVGVVDRVVPDPDSSYVNVLVKPNADLAALEEVLVVVQFSDKMPFAQAKDLVESEAVAQAAKQRAADILSEKLPSVRDPNAPETAPGGDAAGNAEEASGEGDPARPVRPPQPLHPDRYSPGAAPPAEDLTPGEAPPIAHRTPATDAGAESASPSGKPSPANTAPAFAGGDSALVSRFPAKPGAAAAKPGGESAGATASGGTAAGGTAAGGTVSRQPRPSAPVSAPLSAPVSGGGSASGSGTGNGSKAAAPPARKAAIPPAGDSGGILTPAGMGGGGATVRHKPTPAGAAGSATGSGATAAGATAASASPNGAAGASAQPAAPKPQAPKGQKIPPTTGQSPPRPAPPGGA
jgi:rod shape-determining protein MreC